MSQWVWNARLELGFVCHEQALRWTRWTSQQCEPSASSLLLPESVSERDMPVSSELVARYGPLELLQTWAKARRRFSAQDFIVLEDDTLQCPAGKVLRLRERRKSDTGDLRVLYVAKAKECRRCPLAPECLGRGASGAQPRLVSGVRRVVGWQLQDKAAGERQEQTPIHIQKGQERKEMRALQWCDVCGRHPRRALVRQLRCQQVTITETGTGSGESSSGREQRLWTRGNGLTSG